MELLISFYIFFKNYATSIKSYSSNGQFRKQNDTGVKMRTQFLQQMQDDEKEELVMKRNGKRIIAWFLVMVFAFTMLTGCGAEKNEATDVKTEEAASEEISDTATTSTTEATDDAAEADVDGGSMDTMEVGSAERESSSSSDEYKIMEDSVSEGGGADDIAPEEPAVNEIKAEAGVLTAGEWNDNENWGYYKNLFSKDSEYNSFQKTFGMDFTRRLEVSVTDGGKPVSMAKVELFDTEGEFIWASYTNPAGAAYVFYRVQENDSAIPNQIIVSKGGQSKVVDLAVTIEDNDKDRDSDDANGRKEEISLETSYTVELTDRELPKKLDLMFMVDTTGSMGDEITYLQEELKDVVSRVKKDNGNLPIRISMNFYKDTDEEDPYVVSANDFTENVDEAQALLNAEYASGGGDFPEAVAQALENAVDEHEWDEDSVKVMILVLDAPPHEGTDKQLYEALQKASRKGIRIIPVASSGVDKPTEFFLRAAGIATGGTYTFLTDDSGVGGSHIEPTIGDYEVEKLNDLLVRVITEYLK